MLSFPLDVTPPRHQPQRSSTVRTPVRPTIEPGSPVTRTAVSMEYASLRHRSHCPLGMYIVPSQETVLEWDAVFFVHKGYYSDSILKFKLLFPSDYPEKPPVVQFVTDCFHPLIGRDGRMNLSPRFRPWRPKEHHVFDVLHFVKTAFKKHALDGFREADCMNKEAFKLYHESTSSFSALATQSSQLSQSDSALFDKDHPAMAGYSSRRKNGILFKKLESDQLRDAREMLGLKEWTLADDN